MQAKLRRVSTTVLLIVCLIVIAGQVSAATIPGRSQLILKFRHQVLELINAERKEHGLAPLELDQFASTVAQTHAEELSRENFSSHWSRDGRKPYMRYAFAGGTDGAAENISSLFGAKMTAEDPALGEYLNDMHRSLYEETPPNDGHRQTILKPQNTHVGIGIAVLNGQISLVEEFLCRYTVFQPLPAMKMTQKASVSLTGKLTRADSKLRGIEVYYEPLPTPPDLAWLRISRPYGLPDKHTTLRPQLTSGDTYIDGTRGEINLAGGGAFRFTFKPFEKKPGIYTIVAWITTREFQKPFPVTNICIQVE
ncbi:MAG TPA: CAP domain-containing protein [Acidobacteriota bacterium]|nr:CAP domain-containing protein [Acidobacteriota bacterium]HNB70761.1 CAP domain-containing protein [Acidobacteriota bacterium]HNG93372.1 CAP domain-containing protein [Acidobacteriota bacterium]HNH85240.1 CAP domain-containing protein [Acidobacteriota bacterium]